MEGKGIVPCLLTPCGANITAVQRHPNQTNTIGIQIGNQPKLRRCLLSSAPLLGGISNQAPRLSQLRDGDALDNSLTHAAASNARSPTKHIVVKVFVVANNNLFTNDQRGCTQIACGTKHQSC